MTEIIDTLLNLLVFIYVGLMIWLYFKETPDAPSQHFDAQQHRPRDECK